MDTAPGLSMAGREPPRYNQDISAGRSGGGKEEVPTKRNWKNWLRYLPAVLMAACMVGFLLFGTGVEAEELLNWSPENPYLAALFLIGLYALKSMTVFFPLVVLYLAGGLLFPLPAALLVNLIGLAVCDTAPYLVGRLSAAETMTRLRARYPRLETLERIQRENDFLFALLTRAVGVLPGDVVSLYLGAVRLPYGPYLAGSLLGLCPTMVAVTIMGESAADPLSPGFLIALGCDLAIVAASFLVCRRMLKKKP